MVEHESAKEDDMHSMHDEPMMEDDEPLSFGPAIDEEQADIRTTRRVAVFSNTCPHEVRVLDGIALHEVGRLEEHGVSS